MNYPNGIRKEKKKDSIINSWSHKNRGLSLEGEINDSNEYYRNIDKAYIYKKPTPIKITKVDYPTRASTVIKEAFFTIPSTTDYNGLYQGKYIDFEAKETKSKTSFSLSNIHSHQIKHLQNIENHQGISFLIVRFSTLDETYLLQTKYLTEFLKKEEKKSIPISYFREKGFVLKNEYQPRIDYLKVVDQIIGGI